MSDRDRARELGPVAILGAGSVGGDLGERLAISGVRVRFGVRPPGGPIFDVVARRRKPAI